MKLVWNKYQCGDTCINKHLAVLKNIFSYKIHSHNLNNDNIIKPRSSNLRPIRVSNCYIIISRYFN